MALDLGDLVGRLRLEDDFTPVIDNAEKKSSGFQSTLKGLAIGVGAAMAAVGVAAAVGVGALIKTGIEYNAEMSTYETNLSTLLGSTEAAKDMMGDLSSFAASTPFEMPTLASASQTLLSFGSTAQDLMPDLKMLGDISLGNSEKMAGLSVVFGQVQSAGRLMGQDVLQMINQGFNPLVEISKMTGESMVDLKKRMEDGGVSFEEVRAAMQHATSEGGQFFNAMQAGSMTFNGQISTLTDGINILSGAITQDLTASLTGGALPAINDIVGALVDLVNGTDGAADAVDAGAAKLTNAIANSVGPAIQNLAGNLGTVITAVAPALGQVAVTLVASLAAIIPSIIQVAGTIIGALVQALADNAPMMISAAIPAIFSLITSILDMLPTVIEAGIDILLALITGITDNLPTLIPAVVDGIIGLLVALLSEDSLNAILGAGLAMIMGLIQGLLDALPTLIAALPAIIVGIITFIIESIPQLIQAGIQLLVALVGALPQIIDAIVKAIPEIIVGIVTALIQSIPQIIMAGIQLLISLIANLPTIIIEIVKAVPQIIDGLIKAFSDPKVWAQFAEAGANLVNGLWSGIQDIWNDLVNWFTDAWDGLVGGFMDFFGIHSPSTLFAGFGVNIGQGLIDGLAQIQPEVDASFQAMQNVPVPAGAMAGSSTTSYDQRSTTVIMEASRSTLDEEAIYEALGGPRVD